MDIGESGAKLPNPTQKLNHSGEWVNQMEGHSYYTNPYLRLLKWRFNRDAHLSGNFLADLST